MIFRWRQGGRRKSQKTLRILQSKILVIDRRSTRYYQALMDVDKLKSGEPYKNLKDSIIIFICTFDPFDSKKPKYEFKNIDITDGKLELGDRTTKIFFNVNEYDKIKDDEELKSLLKYFSSNKTESSFTHSLNELVKKARHNVQWRQSYMTQERFEYYAKQQGIREGIIKQKAEDEKLLQQTIAHLTAQKNAENARLLKEIEELKRKLKEK